METIQNYYHSKRKRSMLKKGTGEKDMAVYDKAHELAKTIRESAEFEEYKKIKEELFLNPELKAKIEEFEKIRYEVQMLTIQNRMSND